ncbi:MAG: hypothetical protein HY791_12345 [Deltaproteobacteria bacterium]|nr:hypothetical protein [Deltaproteobacteria bacterium]
MMAKRFGGGAPRSRAWLGVLAMLTALFCCNSEESTPESSASLRLVRATDGSITVALDGSERARAFQAELVVESNGAWVLDSASALDGVNADTIRGRMRGANRAILFVGDKRGTILPNGPIAGLTFRPEGAIVVGRVRIASAAIADADAKSIPVALGGSLSLP